MKNYKYILFDLDGTIIDSSLGVTNSVMYSLKKLGEPVPEREKLYKFIGPPLFTSYTQYCGFSEEKANLAIKYYREHFEEKELFNNKLFEGIEDMLSYIKDNGKTLIVATSKPEVFAQQILDKFGISKYFDFIVGATFDGKRNHKNEVLNHILENCNIDNKQDCVLVGDTKFDAIGAKTVGIDCIGVAYGFGTNEELLQNGVIKIADTPKDLKEILI